MPHLKMKRRESSGFALLVTIVLVAFLVLILVTLASLTRIETRVASNAQAVSASRQNALFSLNLALGRLQVEAGPDDRLTARGDITTAGPAYQPYLTGIWTRTNSTNIPDAWMVSGDPADPIDTGDVLDPAIGTTPYDDGTNPWVFLVGDGSVNDPSQRVRMATRAIDAPAGTVPGLANAATIGHYAWWISDEGIKASASLVDPLLLANPISYDSGGTTGDDWSDDIKRTRLNQLQPVRPRLERLFSGLSPDTTATAGQLHRVVEDSQLDLVAGGPASAERKAAFHSVTPLAEGVLLDHYNNPSRLRFDLSDLNSRTYMGTSRDAAVHTFQQFRATVPNTAKPYEAVYHPAASLPSGTTSFPAFHAGPVVTEFGLRFYFSVDPASGEIMLNYLVEAELWNPYAERLEMEKGPDKPLSIYIDTGLKVDVKDDRGVSYSDINVTKLIVNANGGASSDDDDAYGILIDINEVWQPGEVRVLSGGTTLSEGGFGGVLGTGKYITGFAVGDGTVVASISQAGITQFDLSIRFNETAGARPKSVQRYHPSMTFSSFSDKPNNAYACGYGFNLYNYNFRWLRDSGNGLDVRCPYLKPNSSAGPIYPTDSSKRWDENPVNNATQTPDGAFINLPKLVLYNLPRQELLSVGDLRQMTGEKNAELGSGHAGGVNQWYDHYFFSTVPRVHEWDFAGGEPLPNRYIRHIPSDRAATTIAQLRDYKTSARFLLNRGGFNVNSTSEDAWRMMLGQRFAGWKGTAAPSGIDVDNAFLRLAHGAQQLDLAPIAAGATPTTSDTYNTGGLRLTDDQIKDMAEAIVLNIKTRGRPYHTLQLYVSSNGGTSTPPFFSAAVKVNRAAFASSTPGSSYRYISSPPGEAVAPADLSAAFAPVMAVRSDTFLIRSYGDSRNPVTGTVDARAWCEAVVQRVPDVTDPVSGSYADGDEVLINTKKYPFGRKFKIVSFRWLSAQDI